MHIFIYVYIKKIAGLSVAEAVQKTYSQTSHSRVLVCVGPGNKNIYSWFIIPEMYI